MAGKDTRATLVIELRTECPYCAQDIELLSDTDLNEEGDLLKQTITDEAWEQEPEDRLNCDVKCPHCHNSFTVKGVYW